MGECVRDVPCLPTETESPTQVRQCNPPRWRVTQRHRPSVATSLALITEGVLDSRSWRSLFPVSGDRRQLASVLGFADTSLCASYVERAAPSTQWAHSHQRCHYRAVTVVYCGVILEFQRSTRHGKTLFSIPGRQVCLGISEAERISKHGRLPW